MVATKHIILVHETIPIARYQWFMTIWTVVGLFLFLYSSSFFVVTSCFMVVPKHQFISRKFLPYPWSSLLLRQQQQQQRWFLMTKNDDDSRWKEEFLKRFQGDFDNYDQVLKDRQNGLFPREGGGHEHIHCTLLPLLLPTNEDNVMGRVMAAFYFNGIPDRIFRLRLYTLLYRDDDDGVHMCLSTFQSSLEQQLKATPFHQWKDVLHKQLHNKTWDDLLVPLPNCDVIWTETPDPQQHAYAYQNHPLDAFHAVMVSGPNGTVVPSQMTNNWINIRDELSLWENEFWINDRGLDPNNSSIFIYGNQRGIPYQLKRVTHRILPDDNNNHHHHPTIIHPQLEWTLGPNHRTESLYEQKMNAIHITKHNKTLEKRDPSSK